MEKPISIGLARMHKEPGERRDFLPGFVSRLGRYGAQIVLEYGYGSGMSLLEENYRKAAPTVRFAPHDEVYKQDIVLVLRYPADQDAGMMRPGACLISMLHYPTRPDRIAYLKSLGVEAISLDSLKDDNGRRLVENLKSVAWNGIEVAFKVLQNSYPEPGFGSPERGPVRVTLLGAGAVGSHVISAAIRYGNDAIRTRMASANIPGVIVTAIDYDITPYESIMAPLLRQTDILVDATQRPNPSYPVIPNDWIRYLPAHAILLDLSVDPYQCMVDPPIIKGIEGIPQGNLDQYIFSPQDPAWDLLPGCASTEHRRYAISCYSWPGIYPRRCMEIYGRQIRPILHMLLEKGGPAFIDPDGNYFERAISRAMLTRWASENS